MFDYNWHDYVILHSITPSCKCMNYITLSTQTHQNGWNWCIYLSGWDKQCKWK